METGDQEKPTIVLVDGFALGQSNLPFVHIYYERMGFRVVRVPFEWRNVHDIRRYSSRVAEVIKDTHEKQPDRKLAVLSYSMGGLATMYALKHQNAAQYVRHAISYATPYHGVSAALLGLLVQKQWPLMRQLRPGSPFLAEILHYPLETEVRFTSIAGLWDIVCPAPFCRLKYGDNITVGGGHYAFMFRPDIHAKIIPLLK